MHPLGKALAACWLAAALPAAAVDYLREVKPLLTEHCVTCHGADQQKGGLRLDTAANALKGGDNGPAFAPGKAADSLLVQVVEDRHAEISRMPYKKPPLATEQIAALKAWIDGGAAAPTDEVPGKKVHWAFVAPERPAIPAIANRKSQIVNPIDAFIAARLEKAGITDSPEADRVTLLRRVHLDLTGLPPSPAQVEAFLADTRPDAYERVVEDLLSSPHYGERWGRWWLDVARYADSNGYSIDAPRSIWPWRDWVIRAFNDDKPFDEFVSEQLAGDLLADAEPSAPATRHTSLRVATGFHRNTQINEEGGIDPEQFRIESVIDRVNTTGTALLGLTVGCAQCHDHKFDPLSQREYFQLFAFFNQQEEPSIEAGSPEQFAAREAVRARVKPLQAELDARAEALKPKFAEWEAALTPETREKLPLEVRNVLGLLPADRKPAQAKLALEGYYRTDAGYREIEQRLREAKRDEPKIPTTMVLAERKEPRDSFIFIKGDFTRRGADVSPATPKVLHPFLSGTGFQPVSGASSHGTDHGLEASETGKDARPTLPNRLGLARWLVDPANPLTARVTVNRVWQQYFGRGLVETENDFGTQGIPPTHPELLDWLAVEFMQGEVDRKSELMVDSPERPRNTTSINHPLKHPSTAWSLKHLHRLIVTSATYRQSSKARPDLAEKDPTNKLLARQNRLRLDAEIVRDVALAASGRLNPAIGGPSVFPPQPAGVMSLGQSNREWKASTGADRFRRGMYSFFWRATPHPALAVFDAPDAFSACTRRLRSNTPLQALMLLNDAAFVELADALAQRIQVEAPEPERLAFGFRLCTGRTPQPAEKERLQRLLDEETRDGGTPKAWQTFARVLLNLDETITRE
jgi:mono/diheme cytochrome c family protein